MDPHGVVREHRDVAFTICLQVLRHRQDAEDACQEALLKVARSRPDVADPAAWVHRVALRTALDHRRARLRRKAREERSARPERVTDAAAPAVLEALATLPDEDRAVLLEHFFARKTLRAMADARGITEPAVWKRVEKGKERLRQALLATAPALAAAMDGVLQAVEPATAPARVLPVATAKTAVLLAALALPAAVAAGLAARQEGPEAAVPTAEAPPAAIVEPAPSAPPPAAVAPPSAPVDVPPYPWELPPRHWPEVRRTAWRRLTQERMQVSATDATMQEILADLTRQSGVVILLDSAVAAPARRITYKVRDLVLESALKLLVSQFALDAALRSDGIVWVTSPERQAPEPDPLFSAAEAAQRGLLQARRWIAAGREGLTTEDPVREALGKTVEIPAGSYRLEDLADRLREATGTGLHVMSADPGQRGAEAERERQEVIRRFKEEDDAKGAADRIARYDRLHRDLERLERASLPEPRPYGGGRMSMKAHLDAFAGLWGAGYAPSDGVLLICPADQAAAARARADALHAERLSAAAHLEGPVPGAPSSMADLRDAFSRATGLRLVCDEAAWPAAVPAASSWRALFEGLSGQGIRWVYDAGAVYLVR